jgi:hypothetical protein
MTLPSVPPGNFYSNERDGEKAIGIRKGIVAVIINIFSFLEITQPQCQRERRDYILNWQPKALPKLGRNRKIQGFGPCQ